MCVVNFLARLLPSTEDRHDRLLWSLHSLLYLRVLVLRQLLRRLQKKRHLRQFPSPPLRPLQPLPMLPLPLKMLKRRNMIVN